MKEESSFLLGCLTEDRHHNSAGAGTKNHHVCSAA